MPMNKGCYTFNIKNLKNDELLLNVFCGGKVLPFIKKNLADN